MNSTNVQTRAIVRDGERYRRHMRAVIGISVAWLSVASLYACGGDVLLVHQQGPGPDGGDVDGGGVSPDADRPDTSPIPTNTNYPAFKVDAPQIVTGGGPQLQNAEMVPVFFSNDDPTFDGKILDFLGKLPTSAYWKPPTEEYGVGLPSLKPEVKLLEAAPGTTTDMEIQAWLDGEITAKSLPAPNANTLYLLYYPTGTTISEGQGQSCKSFGGYHNSITHNGQKVAYAVMPRCANFGSLTGINVVTGTSSHEILEAVTDPYPQQDPGYAQVDANHIVWEFILGGGENGDMCAQFKNAFYKPSDLGYSAQRCWSNKAAKAGHNPCLPDEGTPYFNAMPVLTDTVLIGGQFNTKAVKIPVGQSKTIELDLFSDGPTAPWYVDAVDTASQQGQPANLSFTFDKQVGQNGDKLMLTIKVLKASQFNAEGFILTSSGGTQENLWIGLVSN